MARRKNRFFVWLLVVVILGICVFFGYVYIQGKQEKKQDNKDGVSTDTWLTIIDTSVKYREESMTIDMLKGTIKTNEQVDKIFVNINGIGTQYLEFTPSLIQTTNSTYIAHNITPLDAICSVGVEETQTVTIDLYVEYAGRSFRVDTQKIAVVSSAFQVLNSDVEYGQGLSSIQLKSATLQTNAQIDKVFVNINGVGTQYLTFTTSEVTTERTYYEHKIEAINGLCATVFGSSGTVTVDLYVEYGGRCYKAETQEVSVSSCWTKNY